eukprot:1351192-Pleurochrysis_carterae.AAC.3
MRDKADRVNLNLSVSRKPWPGPRWWTVQNKAGGEGERAANDSTTYTNGACRQQQVICAGRGQDYAAVAVDSNRRGAGRVAQKVLDGWHGKCEMGMKLNCRGRCGVIARRADQRALRHARAARRACVAVCET